MDTNWVYLKDVISFGNAGEIHEALVTIKDSVIGSNKHKSALIFHGILPILIQICSDDNDITNKIEALIILGSLAKGTTENVQVLINDYKILLILKKELTIRNNYKYCLEICLSTLCSILRLYSTSIEDFFDDICTLPYFLSLTLPENSLKTQIYVTTILFLLCKSRRDQLALLNACAITNLARLIIVENEHIQIPVLQCLCRMCFENRSVSDIICVTSFQGRSILDVLNSLISRSFSPEIQLSAAKCLTYIYRSGTLLSSDFRILHRTLPCLVRLCSENFSRSIRGAAVESLAYLIEIDAELQKTAAISSHLLKSLFQLIKVNDAAIKQVTLECFAALGANDETIRKKIMDTNSLISDILECLNDWKVQVRLASVRCLHSLSRSVQQLRTTFQAEHKKINTSKSGQGGATYVSKYEYFAALHFLDTVRNRGSGGTESNFETLSNCAFEGWDDVEEQFQDSEAQCSLVSAALENSTPAKRRKVQEANEIDSQRSEVYEKLSQFLSQKVSHGKEDISWQKGYGEYVGQQLSAYSESDARRLRTLINNVIDSFEPQQNN